MIHETLVWAETDADPMFDPVPLTHHQWIQLHPPMTHSDPTHVESRADGPLELRITGRTLRSDIAAQRSCIRPCEHVVWGVEPRGLVKLF